jgi:hypothetical protein
MDAGELRGGWRLVKGDFMDGITIAGQTGRLWLCKKEGGHALGLRVKVQVEGLLVEQLMLFRNAVMPQFAMSEAQSFGFLEGTMYDIPCSLCNATRTWWMGNGAKKRALKTYVAE